jgi:hypothetical protein
MSLLGRLEAALERLAEGGAERVFGGRLDLIAVGQELYNAAVEDSRPGEDGPVAPNAYEVRLALNDYGHVSGEVEALQARYAVALWGRLREADYALIAPPNVLITPLEGIADGSFEVRAEFVAAVPVFTLSNLTGPGAVNRLETPATIGRAAECDLRIDRPSVSRKHARIAWLRNRFVVVDLNSSNGTLVNGALVSQAALEPGDLLTVGDFRQRFTPEISPVPFPTRRDARS